MPVSTTHAPGETITAADINAIATLLNSLETATLTTEQVQDIVAALVVAGSNMTVTYDDGAPTLTFASSGGGGGSSIVTKESVGAGAVDLSTTSTGYTQITAVSAVSMPATAGETLALSFTGTFYASTTNNTDVTFGIAGTARTDYGANRIKAPGATVPLPLHAQRLYVVQPADISGGNVAVTAWWKTSAGTSYMGNGGGLLASLIVSNVGVQ